MNIPQETLDTWPRACERLRGIMIEARECLMEGQSEPALELVEFAYIAALVLGNQMQQAGASRPATLSIPPELALHLLSSSANRRYARALRQAYEAGLEVDRERGWGDDGPVQLLKMVLTDVEMQVSGPQESGEGRRT